MTLYSYNSVDEFVDSVSKKHIGMTYKRMYYSDADIKKMFKKLSVVKFDDRVQTGKYYKIRNIDFKPIELIYLGEPMLLMHKPVDYEDFNILSDMFQEENRMKCRLFVEPMDPEQYFFKNTKALAEYCLKKYSVITPKNMRESIYDNVKECTSFRPLNLMFIIDLFKSKSVLDFSSGWGDRLIACLATKTRYVGVDPNELLHSKYQEMIDFFAPKSKKRYTMINDTIQNAKLPNEKFDLVFTSPPYFSMEEYSGKGKVTDVSEDAWFNNFLTVAITKCSARLNENGHMVLVINQVAGQKYIRRMIDYVNKSPEHKDLHYLGVISYTKTNRSNPQPMWIWRKSKTIPEILYNPPMVISSDTYNNKKFCVFRDDKLVGGTKQRAIVSYMESMGSFEKFIYAGPNTGYAQVALAYAAALTNKTAVLFLRKQFPRTNLTKYALTFGSAVELHEIPNANLKQLQEQAEQYNKSDSKSHLFSFGGYDEVYMAELHKMLKRSIPSKLIKMGRPKRLWLVAGSATIANVLYKLFPKTHFIIIQVGKKIWPDQIDESRTTLIISDENFLDVAKSQPPYPTVSTYDAKLWKYFTADNKPGDYIWNVGKDITDYQLGENNHKKYNGNHRNGNHRNHHNGNGNYRNRNNNYRGGRGRGKK